MSKKFKDFKIQFLQELSDVTDNMKEETKQYIGINKNEKKVSVKSFIKNYRKPLTLALSVVILCLVFMISAVSINNYQNTPVYKEMTATNISTVRNSNRRYLTSDDENDILDQIGVITTPGISCYASPLEEIIITIKIDNPKSFEILSFTLNDTKYISYQFEDGSDANQILVKFQAVATSGIQEITINAIKYVDGTKIKDVRFDGNRTIKIGVTHENIPNVTDVNITKSLSSYRTTFVINDLNLILDNQTGAMVYLLEKSKIVSVTSLVVGANLVAYDNLKLGEEYTIVIIGVYDLLDGNGKKGNIMYKDTFITDDGYRFNDPILDYDSITISLEKLSGFDGSVVQMDIYKDEQLISSHPTNNETFTFGNLLSNNDYTVKVTYEYMLNNQSVTQQIECVVHTNERPDPEVSVSDESIITSDGINLVYNINDTTNLGGVEDIEFYKIVGNKEEKVLGTNYYIYDNLITGLYSNTKYKLYVTYNYNKLDGNGIQNMVVEYTFTTLALKVPYAVFTNGININGEVSLFYKITDDDNLINILSIQLYKYSDETNDYSILAEEVLKEKIVVNDDGTGKVNISNLESIEYKAVIVYEYNLNDGLGNHRIDSTVSEIDDYDSTTNKLTVIPIVIP